MKVTEHWQLENISLFPGIIIIIIFLQTKISKR